MMFLKFILIALLFSVTGCVNSVSNYYKGDLNENITINDKRPNNQKRKMIMSLNIASCKYGSYQLGDKDFIPDRVKWLAHKLSTETSLAKTTAEVDLLNFTFHVNHAAGYRKIMSDAQPGALNVLINDTKVTGCSADDLYGGYITSERKDDWAPIITVIDISVSGKSYHGRAVTSLGGTFFDKRNPEWDNAVKSALEAAFVDFKEKL